MDQLSFFKVGKISHQANQVLYFIHSTICLSKFCPFDFLPFDLLFMTLSRICFQRFIYDFRFLLEFLKILKTHSEILLVVKLDISPRASLSILARISSEVFVREDAQDLLRILSKIASDFAGILENFSNYQRNIFSKDFKKNVVYNTNLQRNLFN